jgi:hypothetical protein
MYAQFIVEFDGKFGPYSMCNPVRVFSFPLYMISSTHLTHTYTLQQQQKQQANGYDTSNWFCGINCFEPTEEGCQNKYPEVNGTGWSGSPQCFCERTALSVGREMSPGSSSIDIVTRGYPKQCASGFDSMKKSCITSDKIYKNLSAWSFASLSSIACQTCYADDECTGWISYDNRTAHLFSGKISNITTKQCVGAVRHKSSWSGGNWFGIANLGGCSEGSGCTNVWYSTREEGECKNGVPLGTNGCTWRLVETRKYVNASCVDRKADMVVESHGKTCFDKCPQPLDRNTNCYLDCYRNTLMGDAYQNITAVDPQKMIEPWKRAFEEDDPSLGGCPPIQPHIL